VNISPNFQNDPNVIFRDLGKMVNEKNLKPKNFVTQSLLYRDFAFKELHFGHKASGVHCNDIFIVLV
jgi:hypothetical protein